MLPLNVLIVTSGLPETVNCFSSCSRDCGKSDPDISTHALAPTSAATATVSRPSLPSILRFETIAILRPPGAGPLDGRRDRGVSGIDEVPADVSLHDREVRVEHRQISRCIRRKHTVTHESKLSRR